MTVAMGQPIELHCNAHGSPAPSVSWFHQLRDEEPMLESDSDLLYIPSAHVLDNGEYDNVEDLTTQDPRWPNIASSLTPAHPHSRFSHPNPGFDQKALDLILLHPIRPPPPDHPFLTPGCDHSPDFVNCICQTGVKSLSKLLRSVTRLQKMSTVIFRQISNLLTLLNRRMQPSILLAQSNKYDIMVYDLSPTLADDKLFI